MNIMLPEVLHRDHQSHHSEEWHDPQTHSILQRDHQLTERMTSDFMQDHDVPTDLSCNQRIGYVSIKTWPLE